MDGGESGRNLLLLPVKRIRGRDVPRGAVRFEFINMHIRNYANQLLNRAKLASVSFATGIRELFVAPRGSLTASNTACVRLKTFRLGLLCDGPEDDREVQDPSRPPRPPRPVSPSPRAPVQDDAMRGTLSRANVPSGYRVVRDSFVAPSPGMAETSQSARRECL